MSVQRRHGQLVKIYRQVLKTDRRGSPQYTTDLETPPYEVRAAIIPQRSSKSEVPGQQEILVYRLIITSELTDVGLWSRVEWNDRLWDLVTPPAYHHGTRATRHWSIDIRERPDLEA